MATTELDVIRKFMKSLDNTKKKGTAALNEAVKSASGGKFPTMQSLINSFASDLSKYGGSSYSTAATSKFLTEYCGIVLSNADTGAITGADAGGTKVKTAASIVPESGTTSNLVYPTGKSSTISGVTVKWPDSSTLSSVKKAIVSRLNTWWLSGALDLIEESFGLSFKESGATVKKIPVNFYYASNGVLAYVEHFNNSSTGNATSISLNVNMKYYSNLNLQDVNGKSSNSGSIYLDRLLAHELTHAVMATNIKWFANLPKFVKEGLAEL
ncbi:MAG: hypothetical protein IKO94_01275, partial [Selenomonadaceae bacterium]|nr:hypothetical protein [Selenomonadaceae bacterium]